MGAFLEQNVSNFNRKGPEALHFETAPLRNFVNAEYLGGAVSDSKKKA
jgi:hypothetical protein